MMFQCRECKNSFVYDRNKGHNRTICRKCRMRLRRHKYKNKLIELFGSKCKLCGYNKCKDALIFHHKNPETKLFEIGEGLSKRNWKELENEAMKCELICHNCHSEIHAFVAQLD